MSMQLGGFEHDVALNMQLHVVFSTAVHASRYTRFRRLRVLFNVFSKTTIPINKNQEICSFNVLLKYLAGTIVTDKKRKV